MDKERFEKFAAALNREGVTHPCPRCGNKEFQIVGETFVNLQDNPNQMVLGGPGIHAVIVGCSKCGCLFQHAVNLLLEDNAGGAK